MCNRVACKTILELTIATFQSFGLDSPKI